MVHDRIAVSLPVPATEVSPSSLAKRAACCDGAVGRAHDVVGLADAPASLARLAARASATTVLQLPLEKGGPADSAGLQRGDVITQLDDVKLDAAHPLRLLLRSRFRPNQRVIVSYTRAGASTQTQLTLAGQHPTCA